MVVCVFRKKVNSLILHHFSDVLGKSLSSDAFFEKDPRGDLTHFCTRSPYLSRSSLVAKENPRLKLEFSLCSISVETGLAGLMEALAG
jgi:hypothetical protein